MGKQQLTHTWSNFLRLLILEIFHIHLNFLQEIKKKQTKATNKKLVGGGVAEIISQIQYKSEFEGKTCKMVDPKYTSMTCSNCGFVNESLTLDDREWDCPECGTHLFRDANAAENVRRKAFG